MENINIHQLSKDFYISFGTHIDSWDKKYNIFLQLVQN